MCFNGQAAETSPRSCAQRSNMPGAGPAGNFPRIPAYVPLAKTRRTDAWVHLSLPLSLIYVSATARWWSTEQMKLRNSEPTRIRIQPKTQPMALRDSYGDFSSASGDAFLKVDRRDDLHAFDIALDVNIGFHWLLRWWVESTPRTRGGIRNRQHLFNRCTDWASRHRGQEARARCLVRLATSRRARSRARNRVARHGNRRLPRSSRAVGRGLPSVAPVAGSVPAREPCPGGAWDFST